MCAKSTQCVNGGVCLTGTVIESLCETAFENSRNDRSAVVRAARCLLSSVTRVLLLADSVVVKQLLHAKEKVSRATQIPTSIRYLHENHIL